MKETLKIKKENFKETDKKTTKKNEKIIGTKSIIKPMNKKKVSIKDVVNDKRTLKTTKKAIKKVTNEKKPQKIIKNIRKNNIKKEINNKLKIGFAFTGSFCTFDKVFKVYSNIAKEYNLFPIVSETVKKTNTRFAKAKEFIKKLEKVSNRKVMSKIEEIEPIGPKNLIDILVVAPCTGNTIAKIANGIADTSVTLAVKSQLRNQKPVVLAVSTNDGLLSNSINIGKLLNKKYIYFVPFIQDDSVLKPSSLVSDMEKILDTVKLALEGKQIQPILLKD